MYKMLIRRFDFIGIVISIYVIMYIAFRTGDLTETLLFGIFAFLCLMALSNPVEHVYFLFFLISFFVFLLGRPFAVTFLNDTSTSFSDYLTIDARLQMNLVMIIGLLSVAFGYYLFGKYEYTFGKKQIVSGLMETIGVEENVVIRETIKPFVIVLYIIDVITNIERIILVNSVGYLESYLTSSSLPGFVLGLSSLASLSLAIYWATLPSKKETSKITLLFLIANILCLFTGRRYEAISSVMVVIMYYILRNTDDDIWISRKTIITGIIITPAVMILLIAMEIWREGGTLQDTTIFELMGQFFSSIGGSSSVIGLEQMYHSELADRNLFFSFGNIWKSLNNNILGQFLFESNVYQSQTVEAALYGHSIGAYLMYKIAPARYLAGGGMGSCFLAELMCDFSYIGVALGSLIIGFFIRRIKDISSSFFNNFFLVFSSMFLFRMPRDSFDYFLNQFVSIRNIVFVVIIVLIVNHKLLSERKLQK